MIQMKWKLQILYYKIHSVYDLQLMCFEFLQFFLIPCANPYEILDACNSRTIYLERQLDDLIESALIFGLPTPTKNELESCRNEIKLIKVVVSLPFLQF